ncbi:MAG: hypothetical protein II483_05135 [Lachnospiraceae bacterium]|nr:hypothetical protein [Lachnospiraceae bacterium]
MAAYATIADVQARMTRDMSTDEETVCSTLLDDAAVIIDAAAPNASTDAKKVVSCRMVIRALGDGGMSGVPMGATQGSMSALGYSQSWTIGSGGSTGELYLGKSERQILGVGNSIGSYSPVQELVPEVNS